jgi:hypothetical protein
MIKNLEIRKDKAMRRPDTDDLWTKIETLQWVLYVIFAIRNERMVVILRKPFGRLMFLGAFAQDVDPIEADVMAIVHYTIA